MATITLTLECTEEERANLIARFTATATAVTGGDTDDDEGPAGDPNGDKRDSSGVVWDARFHGVKMTKNQDGTWRRKKNLTDAEKADADAYEAGCRGAPTTIAQAAAGVSAAPVTLAVQQGDEVPRSEIPAFLQTGAFAPQPTAAPVMAMPGMPAMPAAPVAPPPAPSYDQLISVFQATIARVGQPAVDANLGAIYTAAGVTDMKQLNEDPEVRRKIVASLEALQA